MNFNEPYASGAKNANALGRLRLQGSDMEATAPRNVGLREQLLQQRERNAAEVARLDKALALLEEVPKVEELLDLLRGY